MGDRYPKATCRRCGLYALDPLFRLGGTAAEANRIVVGLDEMAVVGQPSQFYRGRSCVDSRVRTTAHERMNASSGKHSGRYMPPHC